MITLDFKATALPWYGPGGTIGPFHHGIDYGYSDGTPVVIGGTTIGLSGQTGAAGGPHLHVDKRPIGTSIENRNNFLNPSDWKNIEGKVVFAGNNGSAGNMVAIQTDKYEYRFLHLKKINLGVGARIEGDMYKEKYEDAKQKLDEVRKQRDQLLKAAQKWQAAYIDAKTKLDKVRGERTTLLSRISKIKNNVLKAIGVK